MKILCIEDDPILLEMYGEILATKHDVTLFKSAAEAFKHYVNNAKSFELVIVDNQLPGRNGKSLIFDIKAVNPQQKIVVISGDIDSIQLPEKFDIRKYAKPLRKGDLLRIVEISDIDDLEFVS
jgi:DNA-binding NtrC family response regulator